MEERSGLVSIVVPVYNVEKYLDRCVESLVNQTYKNLEIILVDDASPDACPEMCEQWAARDARIKVIHKVNEGQGIARNAGMACAQGEYIYFVDSDDYIALETIEKSYGLAKKHDADIVTFGFCPVNKDGILGNAVVPTPDKYVYTGKEVQTDFLPDFIAPDTATGKRANLWVSASSGIYRLNTLRAAHWSFLSERVIISEDTSSLLRLYKDINTVAILPEAFYYYCENANSFSHTVKKDRVEKLNYFYNFCLEECDKLGYTEEVKNRLAYIYLSNIIGTLKLIGNRKGSWLEKRNDINAVLRNPEFRKILNQTDFRRDKYSRRIFLTAAKCKLYFVCRVLVSLKG